MTTTTPSPVQTKSRSKIRGSVENRVLRGETAEPTYVPLNRGRSDQPEDAVRLGATLFLESAPRFRMEKLQIESVTWKVAGD